MVIFLQMYLSEEILEDLNVIYTCHLRYGHHCVDHRTLMIRGCTRPYQPKSNLLQVNLTYQNFS